MREYLLPCTMLFLLYYVTHVYPSLSELMEQVYKGVSLRMKQFVAMPIYSQKRMFERDLRKLRCQRAPIVSY